MRSRSLVSFLLPCVAVVLVACADDAEPNGAGSNSTAGAAGAAGVSGNGGVSSGGAGKAGAGTGGAAGSGVGGKGDAGSSAGGSGGKGGGSAGSTTGGAAGTGTSGGAGSGGSGAGAGGNGGAAGQGSGAGNGGAGNGGAGDGGAAGAGSEPGPCARGSDPSVLLAKLPPGEVHARELVDGTLIVTAGNGLLCALPPDGAAGTTITTKAGESRVAGDRRTVVLMEGVGSQKRLSVWRPGFAAPRAIGSMEMGYYAMQDDDKIATLTDGSRLAFVDGNYAEAAVRVFDFASDQVTTLVPPGTENKFFKVRATKGALVFSRWVGLGGQKTHSRISASGTLEDICVDCANLVTSPESPWIFTSLDHADTGQGPLGPITSAKARLIHAQTGEQRDVGGSLHIGGDGAFSPDGSVLYALGRSGGVARYDLATSTATEHGTARPLDAQYGGAWLVSQAGESALFLARKGTGGPTTLFGVRPSAWPLPREIQAETTTITNPSAETFTADGSHAAYRVSDSANQAPFTHRTVNLGTGVSSPLPAFPWPAAGNNVVFTQDGPTPDTYNVVQRDLATGVDTVVVSGWDVAVVRGGKAVVYGPGDGRLMIADLPLGIRGVALSPAYAQAASPLPPAYARAASPPPTVTAGVRSEASRRLARPDSGLRRR